MTDDFVHLHVHDEYSPLDGAAKTSDIVRRVAELGQPAVAQTNHGYMLGSHVFYKECVAHGVRPIIGLEAYVAPGSATHRGQTFWGRPEQRRQDLSGSGSYTHLTLLAESAIGVRNLFRLSSRSFTEGFYQKQRIDLGMLSSHQEGLIILSGCLSGELLTRLALGQIQEAQAYVANMKDRFGDRFYIEVMDHGFPEESVHLPSLELLGREHNVPLVATADTHYVGKENSQLHDAIVCVGTRSQLSDPNRMAFSGSGYYLKSRAEMDELSLPARALSTTVEIAERVGDYRDAFSGDRRMPELGIEDPDGELRTLLDAALTGRPAEYHERVERELSVIIGEGFSDYFLVTRDAIQYAISVGIWVGPGRGSVAGSLVAFLLGITGLDPMEHGLYFERFLNEARVSLPDIDTDFQANRRSEVFAYLIDKYGADKCARIGTIGKIGAKKAIEDATRVLGEPWLTGQDMKQKLPRPEAGREAPLSSIRSSVDYQDPSEAAIYGLAEQLEGLARGTGMHAGGFVISPIPISEVIPTFIPGRKDLQICTQFDMKSVEELGLVKIDFLGLSMGDVIDSALRMSDSRLPTELNDSRTFDLLREGDTRAVFQLDSVGMRSLLRRMGPRNFGDIAAVLALYRPGPMGANAHTQYADRLNGKEVVRYPHPDLSGPLQGVLGPTYGVIVFQEQVMSALQAVCGYSLAEADLVRKAMGKKDRALLGAEHARFLSGGKANGYSDAALNALWNVLVPFADYSFNKAHAYGYAILAYWTAYLKAHYPKEYMAAVLSFEEDPVKATEQIAELSRMNIPVLPPSINGGANWTPGKEGLHYGLTSIKGVGEKVAGPLLGKAPYHSWTDYLRRVPKGALNSGVLKALIQSGALDTLGSREGLLEVFERDVELALQERVAFRKGDYGFGARNYDVPVRPADYANRARLERSLLGTELSAEAVVLSPIGALDEAAWRHLRNLAVARPGHSVLRVRSSSWELTTDLRVDREFVLGGIQGLFKVEE